MTIVRDESRGIFTRLEFCRSCSAPIYWSLTASGKRAPFNVDPDGTPTRVNHFETCPDAATWRKKDRP